MLGLLPADGPATTTVDQLLGWRPADVTTAGSELVSRAGDLQHAAGDLVQVRTDLESVWSGAAADAARVHLRRRAAEVDELAAVAERAGRVLLRAGSALTAARAALESVLGSVQALGCTVDATGSVRPPAGAATPTGLLGEPLIAWHREQGEIAAAQAAMAARLTGQVRAALHAARAADQQAQTSLASLAMPVISPGPRLLGVGEVGGDRSTWPSASGAAAGREQSWLSDAAAWVGHRADDAGRTVLSAVQQALDPLSRTAGYATRHPQELLPLLSDGAQMALGVLAMAAGATGEAGGTALDLTGVGAVVGVPINLASAAAIAGGAVLAGDSARRLGRDMHTMYDEAQGAGSFGGHAAEDDAASGWADPRWLPRHFREHGVDFGSSSAADYARRARDLLSRAQQEHLPMKVDDAGVIRVYEPGSNSFGSYTREGLTKTFFKPRRGAQYFADQPGAPR